jgi:hypothetical protein
LSEIFEPTDPNLALLIELAMEMEMEDPIDWTDLNITEKQAYVMMASHVMEMGSDHLTDKAIIVKLLVENFVLNLKLLGKR